MAGTLLLLRQAGWDTHYLNLSSGNLGSLTRSPAQTARTRRREAQAAARLLGATWHAPFCNDLEIFYDRPTLRRVGAVIRRVAPTVILTHSPRDYMEDHMNASRLAVTAAFARAIPGFRTSPARQPAAGEVTIYHALPHGLRDQLRRRIAPGAFVDTTAVHEVKRAALACHESQRAFLDETQGMGSFIRTMDAFSEAVGKLSRVFQHAEGWRRHSHLGFCGENADPLRDALGSRFLVSEAYEGGLEEKG